MQASMHRSVWRLAWPMIVSNLSIPLLGATDTWVMGHMPEPEYLGAIALGATIFSFLFWGFGFLRMATTGQVAQAHGARHDEALNAVFARGCALAMAIGFALIILRTPIAAGGLWLLQANQELTVLARSYVDIRIFAAPFTLLNYVLIGTALGLQNARLPLAMLLVGNLTNIVLDIVFVMVLNWGITGVAMASVIADITATTIGIIGISRMLSLRFDWHQALRAPGFLKTLSLHRDVFIRTLFLILAFAWFTRRGAQLGDITLAANAVLLNFQHFLSYGLDGFAHAAEALVGRYLGARDNTRLKQVIRSVARFSAWIALGVALVYAVLGPAIIQLLTDLPEVREAAHAMLPWIVLSPIVSVACFVLDGIFIGAARGADMRNSMLVAFVAGFVPALYLLGFLGNHGLWLSLLVFLAARGISLWWLLKQRPLMSGANS